MDPTFQPYEDKDINMYERARLIDELKAEEAAQETTEPSSNEATLSPAEALAIEAKIAKNKANAEAIKAKAEAERALEEALRRELEFEIAPSIESSSSNTSNFIDNTTYGPKAPADVPVPCSDEYGCGEEAKASWESKVAKEATKAAREEARVIADKEASEALGLTFEKSHVEVNPTDESPRTRDALYFNDFSAAGLDGFSWSSWSEYIYSGYYTTSASFDVDLSSVASDNTVELTFDQNGSYCGDYGNNAILVSSDSGATWTTLLADTGCDTSWVTITGDLTSFIGSSITIQLSYTGSNAHNWYIDNLGVNSAAAATECTDAAACNTGVVADCEYAVDNFDCDGNCIVDTDCNGVCGGTSAVDECGVCDGPGADIGEDCFGTCLDTHPNAISVDLYVANYGSEKKWWLTNSAGDTIAGCPNGYCYDNYAGNVISGHCLENDSFTLNTQDRYGDGWDGAYIMVYGADGSTIVDGSTSAPTSNEIVSYSFFFGAEPVYGCTDPAACNYDASADTDDNTCIDANGCGSCPDADGNVDESCLGCIDSTACNYDADATVDDSSCAYTGSSLCPYSLGADGTAAGNTGEAYGVDYYSLATDANWVSYSISLCGSSFDTKLYLFDAVTGSQVAYNDDNYSVCGSGGNSHIDLDGSLPAGDYIIAVAGYSSAYGDYSLAVTYVEGVSGCGDPSADNYSDLVNLPCLDGDDEDTNPDCCDYTVATGCMDSTACNYDASAVQDSGLCEYAGDSFGCPLAIGDGLSGDASDFGKFHGFSVPEGTVVTGVVSACGTAFDTKMYLYDSSGTQVGYNDDGCSGFGSGSGYASQIDFGGTLAAGDYVVQLIPYSSSTSVTSWTLSATVGLEVVGCMDSNADNYDADANTACSPDCCQYSQIFGCMDSTACNYNADATASDDSCAFAGETCDCPATDGVSSTTGYYSFGAFQETCAAVDGFGAVVTWTQADGDQDLHIMASSDCSSNDLIDLTGYPTYVSRTDNASVSLNAGDCFTWQAYDWYGYSYSGTDVTAVVSENPDPSLVGGCTDPNASNYDSTVDYDDNSCSYPGGSCDDPMLGAGAGSLDGSGSESWHSIVLPADLLSATFDVCDAGCDTKLAIFQNCDDTAYTWYNDDSYGYCGSSASAITIDAPPAGTYYVKVYPYSSCSNDYTLVVTETVVVEGCTDSGATNYDANANTDCADADADGVLDCCEYPASCTDYTVVTTDQYTDGWDGASISIGVWSSDGPIPPLNTRTETVCLVDGIYDVTVGGGSYASEHTWSISDDAGNEILSGGDPFTGCLDNSEDSECPTYGCMLAGAPNYDSTASIDDGSCSYFPGANYGYWYSGTSWSGMPYNEYYLDCSMGYILADCLSDDGASTPCAEGEADGIPDAIANGECNDGIASGASSAFCSELGWDSDGTTCDCGSQVLEESGNCYEAPVYGCMDDLANNTDSDATAECTDPATQDDCVPCDFSCPDNAYTVRMGDSYGDGWNGGTITVGTIVMSGPPSGCEHIPETGEEECWAEQDICLADGLYDVLVGGSSYNSEMAWEIVDINESSFNYNNVVLSGGSPYTGTLLAPVPEYTCGDGTCNDASYTDVDGAPGSESCGLADNADACNLDCGLCVWADQEAPVLSSYGTYYTTQDASGADVTYPAIQWSWTPVDEGNTCADIILDPSLDSCYTYSLAGYSCDYLEEANYDCSLVTECGLCWQPDACSEAGGNSSWRGDGKCDVANNIDACGYDGGDCCCQTCDTSGFANYDPGTCGSDLGNAPGYICVDPLVSDDDECTCLEGDDNAANDCEADPAQVCADAEGFCCGEGNSASWVADDCITNAAWLCDGGADCTDGLDEAYISDGGDCPDPPDLGSCLHDYTASGSLTCDTAATDFGLTCGTLAASYGWDCAGCDCPLDNPDAVADCVYSGADPQVGGMSCDEAYVSYGLSCEALHNNYGWNCTGCNCPGDGDDVASNDGDIDENDLMSGNSFEILPISEDIDVYNSFDEDMMMISKVYGFENRPTSGPNPHYPSETWTALAMKKIRVASLNNMPAPSILNLETGEVIPGDSNGNREVSYTFNYEYNGSLSADNVLSTTQFLVYGFTDLASACGYVNASNSAGDITPWAESCNQAGYSEFEDCNGDLVSEALLVSSLGDGVCDADFSCETYDCDDGDCLDSCGVCNGPGAVYDCGCSGYITCADGTSVCDEADCSSGCTAGDLNADDSVDVLDVVALVGVVLSGGYDECGDMNDDGSIDVLDVVAQVAVVLGGNARGEDATSATMSVAGNTLNISGNGFIGAVQMTLSHGSDFSISLTDDAMVADYATNDNTTTLIVVVPGSEEIFTATGSYDIEDVIAVNGSTYIDVIEPSSFTLDAAYPNPFNPSTSLSLNMPVEGYVSVKAYNLVGQVVGVVAEGSMDAGTHTMTWDASSLSSGVYLITAEYAGNIATQKVMLMK
jgi:hypothetical protein